MPKRKILICGITGQLGSALAAALQGSSFQVYGTYCTSPPDKSSHFFPNFPCSFALDVTDRERVLALLSELRPNIVINTAALTHVDACETDQKIAYKINVEGNRNLLEASSPSVLFVYISTYYLFDGSQGFYDESSVQNPLNYYAKTKQLAEQESLLKKNSLVIRTSKIFSWGFDQRNFIARLYDSLTAGKETLQAHDQYTNPILAEHLARAICFLIAKGKTGVYHAGGLDYVSNYQFASHFAKNLALKGNLIKAAATAELQQLAVRPKYCGLKVDKILQEGVSLFGLQQSFSQLREKMHGQHTLTRK